MIFDDLWQTGFVDETEVARVDPVKQKVAFLEPTIEEADGLALQVWTAFQYG